MKPIAITAYLFIAVLFYGNMRATVDAVSGWLPEGAAPTSLEMIGAALVWPLIVLGVL